MNTRLLTDYQKPVQLRERVEQQEETDVRDHLALLWRAKWLIAAVTLVCAVLAVGAAFLQTKEYDATIELAPVSNGSGGQLGGALSSAASQVGGLAALAGISVGGDSGKAEAVAVLESERLTEAFIQRNDLLKVLYHKVWDPQRNTWKIQDSKKTPTLWKANRMFDKSIRKVITNPKSGLVTMTITWEDPELAATWANALTRMANDDLRDKAIRQSERNIEYLNAEAAKSNVVEVKQAIFSILKTEINRAMIARGSDEYAFKVIDPATPPELASSPNKMLWLLGSLVTGFMLSVLYVFARAGLKRTDPAALTR